MHGIKSICYNQQSNLIALFFILLQFQGSNLSFVTAPQTSLPQSIRSRPVVVFRVSEVDEQARETQL